MMVEIMVIFVRNFEPLDSTVGDRLLGICIFVFPDAFSKMHFLCISAKPMHPTFFKYGF